MAGALGKVKWHEQTSKSGENHALQSGGRRRRRRSLRLLLPLLTTPSSKQKKKMFCSKIGKLKKSVGSLGQNYPKWLISPNDSTRPAVFRGKPTVFQLGGQGGGPNDIALWHATTLRRREAPPPTFVGQFCPPEQIPSPGGCAT